MEAVFLIIGAAFGAAIAWFALKSKYGKLLNGKVDSAKMVELQTQISVKDDRLSRLNEQLVQAQNLVSQKDDERTALIAQVSAANTQVEAANAIASEAKKLRDDFNLLQQKSVGLEKENIYLKESLQKQKSELEEIGEQFTKEFKLLADQILEDKSKRFTQMNQENIDRLLKPLDENIKEFKKQVQEAYSKESNERFSLAEKVKELSELNQTISKEARNLTDALKGQVKTQGNWGEMILETILEKSGLRKGYEYDVQVAVKDSEGHRFQPDVVITYPDRRKVVIDSKVSLVAYDRYCAADGVEEQKRALDDLLRSMRAHIDELAAKNYGDLVGANALDSVMMFVPIEPAFLVAIGSDREMWNYAYKKRVLIMSPTNLIPALYLVYDLWQREYRNQNVEKIAERGGLLYDKLASFLENFKQIGDSLQKAQKTYDSALGQLKDGRGNVISQAQQLKELGARAKKEIPDEFKELGE